MVPQSKFLENVKKLLLILKEKGYIQNNEGDLVGGISFICTNQYFKDKYQTLQKDFGHTITVPQSTKAKYIKLAGELDGHTLVPFDAESFRELKNDKDLRDLLSEYDDLDYFVQYS